MGVLGKNFVDFLLKLFNPLLSSLEKVFFGLEEVFFGLEHFLIFLFSLICVNLIKNGSAIRVGIFRVFVKIFAKKSHMSISMTFGSKFDFLLARNSVDLGYFQFELY